MPETVWLCRVHYRHRDKLICLYYTNEIDAHEAARRLAKDLDVTCITIRSAAIPIPVNTDWRR